jgi:pilus assembly protein Flp/PilA
MGADMLQQFRKFMSDRGGATSLEYAVIASLLSISIIAGAKVIGTKLSTNYFWPIVNNLT